MGHWVPYGGVACVGIGSGKECGNLSDVQPNLQHK